MGRVIMPARTPNGVAQIESIPYANGQTFKKGAPLILTAGVASECGATPAAVWGFALEDADSRPGFNAANAPTIVTGRKQEVSAARADRITVFSMRGVNGGTDPVTPVQANVGVKYGIAKDANGEWRLDTANTTQLIFQVADIDVDTKTFFCKVVEAALTQTP
jgi:hypothetical protein